VGIPRTSSLLLHHHGELELECLRDLNARDSGSGSRKHANDENIPHMGLLSWSPIYVHFQHVNDDLGARNCVPSMGLHGRWSSGRDRYTHQGLRSFHQSAYYYKYREFWSPIKVSLSFCSKDIPRICSLWQDLHDGLESVDHLLNDPSIDIHYFHCVSDACIQIYVHQQSPT